MARRRDHGDLSRARAASGLLPRHGRHRADARRPAAHPAPPPAASPAGRRTGLENRRALPGRPFPPSPGPAGRPRTAVQAVLAADLVVASGGGYLTDTWWWHAAGVLSLLSLAQRLGKPTAMFGQGIGPMDQPALRAQARSVLPGLARLGLRESVAGRDLAVALGARPGALAVTGDDALELVPAGARLTAGHPSVTRWGSACGSRPTPAWTWRRRERRATWPPRRRRPSRHRSSRCRCRAIRSTATWRRCAPCSIRSRPEPGSRSTTWPPPRR